MVESKSMSGGGLLHRDRAEDRSLFIEEQVSSYDRYDVILETPFHVQAPMKILPLVSVILLQGLGPGAQGSSSPSASGVHDFDFGERTQILLRLSVGSVGIDTIRVDPPLQEGQDPRDLRLRMGAGKELAWELSVDKDRRSLLSAPSRLDALRSWKTYRLAMRRTKGTPRKGSYVLLSRGHRFLGTMKVQEGKPAVLAMPARIPEKGRIVIQIKNASPDLPLHELAFDLPASWAKVEAEGGGRRFLLSGSTLVLDSPLRPGESCSLYLDVQQDGTEQEPVKQEAKRGEAKGEEAGLRKKEEALRFRPLYARSAWRFLRPPDPRGKRRVVRVVKPGQTTLTLSPLGLEELRPDALGEEVVLKADANYRFVEGSGVLTARANKERVKPRIRSDGRELVFSVKKTGQKRSWKLLSIKVQILPEAFGILRLYLLDGKTWLTQPFAKLL